MPSVQETAYPRFKSNVTPKELSAIYTPTPAELDLIKQMTTTTATRLGCLILLKTFQRLGYAVAIQDVPAIIIDYLTTVTGWQVTPRSLKSYDTSATRKRHLKLIRDYLQLHPYDPTAAAVMQQTLSQAALTKHDLADLINVAIAELVRQRFELPAFSTLKRMAYQARARVTTTFYQQICDQLGQSEREQIDALLRLDGSSTTTTWHDLK